MQSENETVEDIVRELRDDANAVLDDQHDEDCWTNIEASEIYRSLADRIESALRREKSKREMLDKNAHTIMEDSTTYDEHDGVNAIVNKWRDRPITVHTEPEESARLDKLETAYYAEMRERRPRRNCDRFHGEFAAQDAYTEWRKNNADTSTCACIDWLFAPVAKGGES